MATYIRKKFLNAKTYFLAAASVSKPIAFLMAFFGLAFVSSLFIGIFLMGQWGYKKVVNVDQPKPVVVTDENYKQSEPSQKENNTNVPSPENSTIQSSNVPLSNNNSNNKPLPDTGSSTLTYIYIALVGTFLHFIYSRLKKNY